MSDPAQESLTLPVEIESMPFLDEQVAEAIRAEHRRSVLQFSDRFLG